MAENSTDGKIAARLAEISQKIREAESRHGRASGSVKLLAVSKFHTAAEIEEAYKAGQRFFGENRVQEAGEKFSVLAAKFPDIDLHIIGSLQTNKVKHAVKIASVIESVDRLALIEEIEKQGAKLDKKIEVFFELHTGEESKAGFADENELRRALEFCAGGHAPHLIPKGFMTMAPFTKDEALIRKSFSALRRTAEKMRGEFAQFDMPELSMGMTNDFELAIAEGSTQVRVGTAIFGERHV